MSELSRWDRWILRSIGIDECTPKHEALNNVDVVFRVLLIGSLGGLIATLGRWGASEPVSQMTPAAPVFLGVLLKLPFACAFLIYLVHKGALRPKRVALTLIQALWLLAAICAVFSVIIMPTVDVPAQMKLLLLPVLLFTVTWARTLALYTIHIRT